MFQNIDEFFYEMSNVFCFDDDDVLIAVLDELGRDHDAALDKVLRICRQANLGSTGISVFTGAPASLFGS